MKPPRDYSDAETQEGGWLTSLLTELAQEGWGIVGVPDDSSPLELERRRRFLEQQAEKYDLQLDIQLDVDHLLVTVAS